MSDHRKRPCDQAAAGQCDVLQRHLFLRRGRLGAGYRHRVGAIPRARFRPAQEDDAEPGAGRLR